MSLLNKKFYVCLLLAVFAAGCGDAGNKEGAGSAISGIFGPSEAEKTYSEERKAQIEKSQEQAEQMQKDRLGSY